MIGRSKRSGLSLCLILFFSFPMSVFSVVPIDDLYSEDNYHLFQISPKGEFIAAASLFNKMWSVDLLKADSNEVHSVYHFPNNASASIDRLTWIDNDSLVVEYTSQSGAGRLLHLDARIENGVAKGDVFNRNIAGSVLDSLLSVEDTFLMRSEDSVEGSYTIYRVNLKTIDEDQPWKWKSIGDADGARNYWLDNHYKPRLKEVLKDKKLYFYWRKEKEWDEVFQYERKNNLDDVFRPVGFLDKNNIAVLTNIDRDKIELVRFDLTTKEIIEVLYKDSRYDIESASFLRNTNTLDYVNVNVEGRTKTFYLRQIPDNRIWKALSKHFASTHLYTISETYDERRAIIKTVDDYSTSQYYLVDYKKKTVQFLGDENETLQPYTFSKTKSLKVKTGKDAFVEGFLTLPDSPKDKANPLIVIPHGGPIGIRENREFNPETQFYASRGLGVLRVNFRGSHGYGKKFIQSGIGQFGQAIEQDIDAVIEHVIANFNVDVKRICISGGSYGGYSALMSSIKHPKKYRCAASYYGISDLPLLLNDTNYHTRKRYRESIKTILGDLTEDYEKMVRYSPARRVDELNLPVFLLAGKEDQRADLEHSHRIFHQMRKQKKQVEFVILNRSGHGASSFPARNFQMVIVETFLREHLAIEPPRSQAYKDEVERTLEYLGSSEVDDYEGLAAMRLMELQSKLIEINSSDFVFE